jgi:hypothetical protein
MGNGIVLPENVKESIAVSLTEEYKNLSAEGLEENLMREKLTSLYTKLLSEQTATPELSPQSSSNSHTPLKTSTVNGTAAENGNESAVKPEKLVSPQSERKTPIVRTNRTNSLRMENLSPKNNSGNGNSFAFHDRAEASASKSSINTPSSSKHNSNSNATTASKTPAARNQRHTIMATGNSGRSLLARNKSYHDTIPRDKSSATTAEAGASAQAPAAAQDSDHDIDEKEDEDKVTAIVQSPSSANLLSESMSSKTDNWDSVSKQPFCSVCKMAFKSAAFLERHIKYSEVHQKTLEEMKLEAELGAEVAAADSTADQTTTPPQVRSPSIARLSFRQNQKAVDGVDYRQIYHGVKFYWRTKENIDFDVFYHIKSHLIEVVPYDPLKTKEFKRLYFNGDHIHRLIEEEVQVAVEEKIKELSTDRFAVLPPRNSLYTEIQQHASVSYLLARLQKVEQEISFVSNTNSSDASPLLASPPFSLLPVTVIRRRLTAVEEFKPLNQSDLLLVPSTPTLTPMAHAAAGSANAREAALLVLGEDAPTEEAASVSKEKLQLHPSPIKASMIKAKEV